MSGDASGLRRSTRVLNNSSPDSLQKSRRLEKRTPPSTPSLRKKTENLNSLRRSVRENKGQSPSSKGLAVKGSPSSKGSKQLNKGLNTPESLKDKGKNQDKTLKEIAKEVRGQSMQKYSPEVGSKGKKRLDARRYKEMFKPMKKIKLSESESDKKKKLENSDDCGDSGPKKLQEERQEHSDGEGSEGTCTKNIDVQAGDFCNSIVQTNNGMSKYCEGDGKAEDVEDLQMSSDHSLPSSSPVKEAVKKLDKSEELLINGSVMEKLPNDERRSASEAINKSGGTEEVPANGSVTEKLPNQEMLPALKELAHDGNISRCKRMIVGDSAVGSEATSTCPMNAVSVPSSCEMSILAEECVKCLRKRSLDYDSPEQELCCCLLGTVNEMDDSEDSAQCRTCVTAEFAKEHGQNVKQIDYSSDVQWTTCDICKLAGKLLHCRGKGCRRTCHSSCLLNPEKNLYFSNWYCTDCTKKRLAFGVHSVTQGIELVLDVREVELSPEGREKQKQCFVKYKGLAHIHNRWVSEIQLLHEAPILHSMLGKQKEDSKWNADWAVPHRLLQKRSVNIDDYPSKATDLEVSFKSNCWHEWLVKWRGLDYDQVTWESEDSSCFKNLEAQRLIEEYETRHKKARRTPLPGSNEVQEKRKVSHVKLGRHSGCGVENCYQNSVNKLREYHHRGQNAVLLDEQDRFVKVIYLVSSLVTNVCRPFLIITPHASLSSWEAEFVCLASHINVVIYRGNADARNIIRSLEFYEGDQVILQVLLSSAEAIAEDAEELKDIEWEAVIIDDCQQSCILAHSGRIKNLASGWRLLFINALLEDNKAEYINILSLLEPGCSFNQNPGLVANSKEEIVVLKDRLSSFIICARFHEYWVPVEISNLQLEQYCYSIVSKSSALRSFLKSDPVGSLREILISLRQSCDHPYIVDWKLQKSLTEGLPPDAMMDLDIRASGKLYLLEKLLSEFKNLEIKVLILFQPAGGSGRDPTGNILDDFLRWRFGSEAYERVESGLLSSKKQTACNQFNSVKERSFFLLETRACSPSIKLSHVDAVIIFDSDWNPLNDLRALQKITIDSKLEQIKVFRLYCPYTMEEKVLILAKNDVILDSNLQTISPSTSHMLLMWGSSYLFSRLDEFHLKKFTDSKEDLVFGSSLLMDVSQEIVSLYQNRKTFYSTKYISVARQNGGCYLKCIPLIGEQNIQLDDGMTPQVFWTKLLEGKKIQWRYLSGSSQRIRKRVHYFEELPSEAQSDEVTKRRKKMDSTKIDPSSWKAEPRLEKSISGNKDQHERSGTAPTFYSESMANTDPNSQNYIGPTLSVVTNGTVISEFDDIKNLHNEQSELFESLKPTIIRLCEALLLKDDGIILVEKFLEFLVKHYRITREPQTTLQAFLLSVCWTAVDVLKKNIDHKQSLTIARERLGFDCSESEAEGIYLKLQQKMDSFSCSGTKSPHSTGDTSLGLAEKGLEKLKRKVEKRCDKQMENLRVKHDEELEKFEKSWEDERIKLENRCKLKSAAIRVTHANSSVGIDKLRALDNEYAKEKEELEGEILICRKELEARQLIERNEEQKKMAWFMERIKSLGHHKLLEASDAQSGVQSQVTETIRTDKNPNGTASVNGNLPEEQDSEREASRAEDTTESIVSELPKDLKNAEKERPSCEDDGSENASENVTALKGDGSLVCQPKQPCASTGQIGKGTSLMDDVIVYRSTALARDQINIASTTGSFTKQRLGDESHNGVEEQFPSARINNTSPINETLPVNCPNHVPLDLPRNDGTSNSIEYSLNEWVNNDQLSVAPISRLHNQPSENHESTEGTTTSMLEDHNSSSLLGEAVSQILPQLAVDQSADTNHFVNGTCESIPRGAVPAQAGHLNRVQVPVSAIPRFPTPDPLQIELDNIRKEMAKIMNVHEGQKLQLKSECDKEIEELVTQIRMKYDKKLEEGEESFSLKRNELENFQNKVMMNKILAEAFRSKCADYKATPKTQQGVPSSSIEISSPLHYTRPLSATPTVVPHNVIVAARGVGPTQTTIPCFNPIAPGQRHVRREALALSPRIQPLRSSSNAASSGSLPSNAFSSGSIPSNAIAPDTMPSNEVSSGTMPSNTVSPGTMPSNAVSSGTMPSGSVLSALPANNLTSTLALQLPPQPPLSQLNPHGQSHQEGSMQRGSQLSLSLSATELLVNIARRNEANLHQYSSSLPLPDNLRNSESWDLSQIQRVINLQPPSSISNLPTGDVVCLSDDE